MIGYAIKRLLSGIPLILLLTVLEFSLLHLLPGDPVEVLLGSADKDMSQKELSVFRHELGLDRSLPEQYLAWMASTLKGNLGRSYRDGRPVSELIAERMPATFALIGTALVMALILGTFWGMSAVWLRATGSRFGCACDQILSSGALILYCLPSFWVAFLAIAWIANSKSGTIPLLGLHPPGETGVCLAGVLLPASILALRRAAKLALMLRTTMLDELDKDYIRTALAKGLSRQAILLHQVGKNSLGPVIAFLGLSIPALIGGSVLVEVACAWPGMGRLSVDATFGRNYPVLLGLTLIYGTLVIVANLIADIMHRALDPRLSLDSGLSDATVASGASRA